MKWPLRAATFALLAACQSEPSRLEATPVPAADNTTVISLPRAALTDAYKQDITTLCDVVTLSDAAKLPPGERWPVIAMWLGPNIKTAAGHDFLVAIQPLKGEAKALALETEAKRIGLMKCALAGEWRVPPG